MKTDKLLHLLTGAVITFAIGLWFPVWGLVAGVAAGAAKELIHDKMLDRGTYDVFDFLYTAAGAAGAFVLVFVHAQFF
jgi:hypothetical protein